MEFDINTLRGVLTAMVMFGFLGLCFFVYQRKHKSHFDQAAMLPFQHDASDMSDTERHSVSQQSNTKGESHE